MKHIRPNISRSTDLGNKDKRDLFDEWMDSIERLDAFVTNNPTDMEVEDEATDYTDVDPTVLILREEGAYWEPPAIIEATTELKNWAWKRAAHPMDDSVRKIKTVKLVTLPRRSRPLSQSLLPRTLFPFLLRLFLLVFLSLLKICL